MFREAGSGIWIYCDDEARSLRVATIAPLVPGFRGMQKELANFKSEEDWLKSPLPAQVTDESVLDMISWFWRDLSEDVSTVTGGN